MKYVLVTVIIFCLSPIFFSTVSNFNHLTHDEYKVVSIRDQIFIDEINQLRGEASEHLPPLAGRILINKYSFFAKELMQRYLETFDPVFLFFKGDIDIYRSTQSAGIFYISIIIPFLFFFKYYKSSLPIFAIIISNIPASIFYMHYFSLSRMFFAIVVCSIAAIGSVKLFNINKKLFFTFIFLFTFEFLRFYHDLLVHYPSRLFN